MYSEHALLYDILSVSKSLAFLGADVRVKFWVLWILGKCFALGTW